MSVNKGQARTYGQVSMTMFVRVHGKKFNVDNGYLNLEDKNIKSIAEIEGLDRLPDLRRLSLSKNQIAKIEGLDPLTNLEELYLDHNQITKIEGLDPLTNLKVFYISNNQIAKIEGLDTLTKLKELYLDHNQIAKIEGLDYLTNLKILDLFENQIAKIEGLNHLKTLHGLQLSKNQIAKIEGLDKQTYLEDLCFSQNQIGKIEGLDTLTKLKVLYLDHNQIAKIEGLDYLTNLQWLELGQNQIARIEGLDLLTNLEWFFLNDNPVAWPEDLSASSSAVEVVVYCKKVAARAAAEADRRRQEEERRQQERAAERAEAHRRQQAAERQRLDRSQSRSPMTPETPPSSQFVQIRRQFEFVGGKIRVKIKVVNMSSLGIHRICVVLSIPQSFRLLRVDPVNYTRDGSTVHLESLLPGEEKATAWELEPLVCAKEMVGGSVSGVDATGNPFAISIALLEIEVRCPLFAKPEESNLPLVQHMLLNLPVQEERAFLLPKALAPVDAFELVKQVVADRAVRFLGTTTGDAPRFDETAWYYGNTKVKHKRFVIKASVSEANRAIRVFTACDMEEECVGFLAETGASIRKALVRQGAIRSEEMIKELYCEKCGTALPCAPTTGHDITCPDPDCHHVWTEMDFP